ncbi:MAG: diaminopimelate epimerase [Candidatus Lindowbacteria bacterium RIFCSPLOWO2_12_FULL_62_27]|nr:MAG: diaminopimelate epimerase [Candidatus Lindowbacteria bacterium RIFCSPLOWO2_12_FULL_62_27]
MAKLALSVAKMQAAGNDFVVVNDMARRISSPARLAARLCHRQFGVGADGLILLQPARNGRSAYRMRIINSDGSEAEMCGNGSRCAVKFAVESGLAPASHIFETLAGAIAGRYLSPAKVRVALTEPSEFRSNVVVPLRSGRIRGTFINTGVPHFVTFVRRLDGLDVNVLGREIRTHRIFSPRGTNVNFAQVLKSGRRNSRIRLRTFERGVESETLACGTGATASAIVAALTRGLCPPVAVVTTGGSVLTIQFCIGSPTGVSTVTMEGPVEKVFETRLSI